MAANHLLFLQNYYSNLLRIRFIKSCQQCQHFPQNVFFFFFFFFFFQLSGTSVLQINQIYCLKVRFLCPFIQNMHRSMGTPKNCRSRHSSWWSSECEKKDFEKFKKEEKKTRKFVCSLKCSSFILKLIAENLLKI